MARQSFIQEAQANICKDLHEKAAAQFFRGMEVIAADPGDIVAKAGHALAGTGLCVVVEVAGGPAPIPEDPTDWDARISVLERPAVNREGRNGKTADLVVDEVLRTFPPDGSGCGHFRAVRVVDAHSEKLTCYVIEGKTSIVLRTTEARPPEC